jgi:uncharacterized Tic20 family protein
LHRRVLYTLYIMKKNNQNTSAFLIHISAFAGFIIPFGHIITPLIAWQTLKERSPFLNEHGKEAINFNLSYTLYAFLLTLTFIPFAVGTFFRNIHNFNNFYIDFDFNTNIILGFIGLATVTGVIYLAGIALVIIASLKAKEGEHYKYPFTIKFIK